MATLAPSNETEKTLLVGALVALAIALLAKSRANGAVRMAPTIRAAAPPAPVQRAAPQVVTRTAPVPKRAPKPPPPPPRRVPVKAAPKSAPQAHPEAHDDAPAPAPAPAVTRRDDAPAPAPGPVTSSRREAFSPGGGGGPGPDDDDEPEDDEAPLEH